MNQLKLEEESKVKTIAEAYKLIGSENNFPTEVLTYLFTVTEQNNSIPILVLNEDNTLAFFKNIEANQVEDAFKRKKTIESFKESYPPILIDLQYEKQHLYYKNSQLLTQLEYYPFILIALVLLFIFFTYWYFRTLRKTEQSFLWAGLAKETAHQIGTPLSSIMGWIELLKLDPNDTDAIGEIENDVSRLQFITDRFSKIGSESELHPTNVVDSSEEILSYLRKRITDKIEISFEPSQEKICAEINVPLFNWVIENLVKNAVDSLKDKGKIRVQLQQKDQKVILDISDNGPGISSQVKNLLFNPGFSTKKRGWGLGLSLAKRIIESYHKGKIFVLKSEPNKQTTFRIQLKSIENC